MADAGPQVRAEFLDALRDYKSHLGVRWKARCADWLRANLEIDQVEAGRLMFEHLRTGGRLRECRETRENWKGSSDFHYDLVVRIGDRDVYFETVLEKDSRLNPPSVVVVNVHWSDSRAK